MIYKITYSEGDTINKTVEIKAESKQKAMLFFWVDHPEANDVSKVEKVQDESEND